jgi:hypothetical protein
MPGETMAQSTMVLTAEDIAFWEQVDFPTGVTVEEIVLEGVSAGGPRQWEIQNTAIPIREERWRSRQIASLTATPTPKSEERVQKANTILSRFGFHLESDEAVTGRYDLYLKDQRILKDLQDFNQPFLSDSGQDFGLLVQQTSGGDCLVRNHDLDCWNRFDNRQVVGEPFFIGERLFWALWNSETYRIDVQADNMVIFSYPAVYMAKPPGELFIRWCNEWLLEVNNTLIHSGEVLNDSISYDEISNWMLADGKPVYLFRKGPWVGISYDGKVLPVYYEEIIHYQCCGLARYNPGNSPGYLDFFASREGVWYFVEVKLPD